MKRTIKKISSCLLVVCLLMLMSVTAFAQDETEEYGLTGPTELFIDVCDDFFTENSNYKAIDKNGNDVTEAFLGESRNDYLQGDYDKIWNAVKNDLAAISWENDIPQTMLLMNKSVSDSFYVLDETKEHMKGKTFEMLYTISGTYMYHDSNGQVSECSDAVLDIESFNAGALFSYEQFGTSTSAKIAGNRKSVTFSAKFSITLSCASLNIPGLTLWTEDFGPYSNSVTGYTY